MFYVARHAITVQRIIGSKSGIGKSSGYTYLKATTGYVNKISHRGNVKRIFHNMINISLLMKAKVVQN